MDLVARVAVRLAFGGASVAHGVFSWNNYFPAMGRRKQEVYSVSRERFA
jgi:hypothetical protein